VRVILIDGTAKGRADGLRIVRLRLWFGFGFGAEEESRGSRC
jgi:hypothetical protein